MDRLNLEQLYGRYHVGIDFLLYAFALVFICRLALSRVYQNSHGKSLGTVIGLILAVSLSATERRLGFSARAFGPIAAGLIIFTVALVIYSLMRQLGTGHAASGSTALIVTYFSMRAVLPGFFLWAKQNEWASYLHGLLVLAILVALWRVIQAMFAPHEASALREALRHGSGSRGGFIDLSRRQDKGEWRIVRGHLRRLTLKGKRECRQVIEILEQAKELVLKGGAEKGAAEAVCAALQDLKAREHVLVSRLARIGAIDQKLMRLDLSQYQKLRREYERMTSEQQADLKRLFAEEREKIGVEQAIGSFETRAEAYAADFDRCMDSACSCLSAGHAQDAASWIEKAVEQEQGAAGLIDDIQKQEEMLLSLLGRQIAELKASGRK